MVIQKSCVPSVMESQLKNDSLLDVFTNAAIYTVLFDILHSFAKQQELRAMLFYLYHHGVLYSHFCEIADRIEDYLKRYIAS